MKALVRRRVGLPARSGRIARHGIGAEKTRRHRMIMVLVPGVGRRRCVIPRMHRVIVLLSEHGQRQQEHAEGDGYGPRSLTWRRHRRSLSRALSRGTADWAARRRAAPGKIDWGSGDQRGENEMQPQTAETLGRYPRRMVWPALPECRGNVGTANRRRPRCKRRVRVVRAAFEARDQWCGCVLLTACRSSAVVIVGMTAVADVRGADRA